MTLSKQQKLGLFGEQWCKDNLFTGFDCYCPSDFRYSYDILLDGIMPIEIKASNEITRYRCGRVRSRYKFDVGNIFHPQGLTVLLCLNCNVYPFIVPNWFISYLNICKKYDNRYLQLF